VRFRPVSDPASLLQELLHLYRLGQTLPLPLFPRTSRAYSDALRSAGSDDGGRRALTVARTAFEPKKHSPIPSEGEDVYVQQLFGDRDPLDPAFRCFADDGSPAPPFAAVACAVFDPLLTHREVVA
jgi:exonuclease V gamma subunit